MDVDPATLKKALTEVGFTPEESDQAADALATAQAEVHTLVTQVGQASALKLDHCRSCGAPVYWLRYTAPAGRMAPIEAAPSATGNCAIHAASRLYHIVPAEERVGRTDLHLNHFATCPEKTAWRRT